MPQEEEHYFLLLESLPDAFAYHQLVMESDGNGKDSVILRVNGAFEVLSGLSRDKVIGKKVSELNPDIQSFFIEWFHTFGRVAHTGEATRFEAYSSIFARWYEITVYSDKPGYFVTLFRHISVSKQGEEVLRSERESNQWTSVSEDSFRYIVEFSPLSLAIIDENGNYEYINPQFIEDFGYTMDDIPTGKQWFRLAYPDPQYRREVIDAWLNDLETLGRNIIRPRVYKVTCKDGSVKDIYFRPVHMDNGKQLLISEDVTEQTRAEEALRDSEERFRQISEALPLPLSISDAEGRNEYFNPRFEEVFGYTLADIPTRKRWFECAYPDPDYRRLVMDIWNQDVHNNDRPEQVCIPRQFRVVCKDGTTKETMFRFVFIENGKRLIIYEDISERIGAEKEIQARNMELSTLYNLSKHMRGAKSSADLLPILLAESRRLLQADHGMVILLTPEQTHCNISVGDGQWADSVGESLPLDQGCFGIVLATGEAYVSPDYSMDEHALPLEHAGQTGPSVFVPLQSRETILGILVLARPREEEARPFSPSEVHLLTAIAEMAGNALHRQQLHESAQQRMNQLQALREIDMAITGSMDLKATLHIVLLQVTSMLNVDAAAILTLNPEIKTLTYTAWYGFHQVYSKKLSLHVGEGFAGRCVYERHNIHIPDLCRLQYDPVQGPLMAAEGFAAYFAVPLIARGQVYGVLEVLHRKPLHPSSDWLKYMETLAGQAAIAVENDRLFTDMQRSNLELTLAYDATIEGWAYALDLRDEETEGHSRRVTELTMRMANALGIPAEQLLHIRRGALLHDIGKMGIPDAILLKPGKLSEQEWSVMYQHPRYAYEMLSAIDYLRPALNIPYCHHERWCGGGYPCGLKGEEIPLEARIFAVVDVYDALTSDRPYRSAWIREKVLEYIRMESGRHFDPQVVELFINEMKEGNEDY